MTSWPRSPSLSSHCELRWADRCKKLEVTTCSQNMSTQPERLLRNSLRLPPETSYCLQDSTCIRFLLNIWRKNNKEWGQRLQHPIKTALQNASWPPLLLQRDKIYTHPVNNLFIFFIESHNRKWLVYNYVRTFTSIQSTTSKICTLTIVWVLIIGEIRWDHRVNGFTFINKPKTQRAAVLFRRKHFYQTVWRGLRFWYLLLHHDTLSEKTWQMWAHCMRSPFWKAKHSSVDSVLHVGQTKREAPTLPLLLSQLSPSLSFLPKKCFKVSPELLAW